MEAAAFPAQERNPQSDPNYFNRDLPQIPRGTQDKNMQRHDANTSTANGEFYAATEDMQIEGIEDMRPELRSESKSSQGTFPPVLPKPPKPPMSKSIQKVLQLTGHDMRYDRVLVEERSEFLVSGDSSSSESVYSQVGERPGILERNISISSAPNPGDSDQIYLSSSIYTASEKSTTPSILPVKGKGSETSMAVGEPQAIPRFRESIGRTYSTEPVTISDFIDETQSHFSSGHEKDFGARYSHGMSDPTMSHLVPAALVVLPKPKKEPSSPTTRRTSMFANARDSMNWGIKELTEAPVIRSKEPAIPENFAMPPPRSTRKKNFSSGKHPLKSPFPFYTSRKSSYPEEPESKLSKRFSGAMKRLSGGKPSPTKTTTIISNSARTANGPDTPVPAKSGFMTNVDIGDTVHCPVPICVRALSINRILDS